VLFISRAGNVPVSLLPLSKMRFSSSADSMIVSSVADPKLFFTLSNSENNLFWEI
jgi:hypothetical protein